MTGSMRPTDDGESARRPDHGADEMPDRSDMHAADRFIATQDPRDAERVAEHHEEMRKVGADIKGEGEIK